MTIAQMLEQSGILTLLGMGVVFGFLIIMILAMTALHTFVHALGWDKDLEKKTEIPATPATDNNAAIAAIATAVFEKESN